MPNKFSTLQVDKHFDLEEFHQEMQIQRKEKIKDVTLKSFIQETWPDKTPEHFYAELGIDLSHTTVQKLLNTTDMTRWIMPEIIRDAIRIGLEYTPFYSRLVTGEESVTGTGITMPRIENQDADDVRLRDVAEGARIPEAQVVTWGAKQVILHKKGRGLYQTYESLMFLPINLAAIYFEEMGTRLGSDLDAELINIAFNGDQADGSEAAPVIGAATANTLAYTDIARAWIRFKRLNRNSSVMLVSEADAITILNMTQFQRTLPAGGTSVSGVTLNINTPLPSQQDLYVHSAIPTGKIVFIDVNRAFVQLTAMPLLIEGERIVNRQWEGEFASIITGFANVFSNGRIILDYTTTLVTNPGPTAVF